MNRLLTHIRLGAVLLATIAFAAVSPDTVFAQAAPSAATPVAAAEATVRTLQEALNRQGISVKVDGVLSEETRVAIRKYQSQHHLPVTGEPDKATLDKLGVGDRRGSTPAQPQTLAQAAPPAGTAQPQGQAQMPGGMMGGGMMMNCPMVQGQMQMMQGQMQAMMQMMQGMMQMMQMMQGQAQPAPMQPGQTQPGQMPMQPGQMQPGAR